MAIAQVQKKNASSTTTSVSAVFDSAITENNLLIALVSANNVSGGSQITITGWSDGGSIAGNTSVGRYIKFLYKIAGAGESTTVTASGDTDTSSMSIQIWEYSSMETSSTLDKTAGTGDDASSVTSRSTGTTATTTVNDELLMAGCFIATSHTNLSWSNSFSTEYDDTTLVSASKIVSSTGAYETTASWTTARRAGALIATFKGSGVTPPATTFSTYKTLTGVGR